MGRRKARAGGAVCALLLWLCFSAGVVVPGGGAARGRWWCPGAVVVLIGGQAAGTSPAAQFPPAQFQPEPFQGGTVSPPDDPAKCRRAKGSDSSLNGISPHR